METYLAVKTFLKKVWTWTKHYWYVPAVIIVYFGAVVPF
jgi:hypothetical protein